ncbi:MAG TPA: polyphenol oxidase family protein [Candidatus Dormibacteraeota bacterium]
MTTTPAVLHVPELADEAGLVHGFSTVALGSVGLTHAPAPEPVMAARGAFARILDVDPATLTAIGAVHGSSVARVDDPCEVVDGVDALVTDRYGVGLFATFADCYPIVLWDADRRCAGLAHAGWRGTLAGVAGATVRLMRDEYGAAHLRAGIGPGICGRCYEVGPEVAEQFDPRFVTASGDRFLLDLAAANRTQLEEAGVEAVHEIGMCTKESYLFPSHRRHPDGTRFGAIVGIK